MLSGQHHCVMDEKGRVAFPAAFRSGFGLATTLSDEDLGIFHLTQAAEDSCLVAYTPAGFEELKTKVAAMPRSHPITMHYRRFVIGAAASIVVDKAGRVNIPRELREYAGLGRDVIWVGELQVIELWSRERLEGARRTIEAISVEDRQAFREKYDL
jgi:MraZ protein